jgi:imidazolonepropionase-like amidohydrolase
MRLHTLLAAVLALAATAAIPAVAAPVAIVNARLMTAGPQGEIARGVLVMDGERILAVGDERTAIPAGARRIDAGGAPVTPGFIASRTLLGLVEVSSVDGTTDGRSDDPQLSAAFEAQRGLNPRSALIPAARLGGITRALVAPDYDDGSPDGPPRLFAGQAAFISLDPAKGLDVRPRVVMVLDLGEEGAARAGGARGVELAALRAALEDVRFYLAHRAAYDRGETRTLAFSRADLEALAAVVDGRQPLLVSASRESDIREALALAKAYRLKMILSGAEEGWRLADEIARAGVPVILNPTANLPTRFETLGADLRNAARLRAAGVEIAILGGDGAHRVREMRYFAGIAVARGLPYDHALQALTLGPARIFGVSDRLGSLSVGKLADVVIWSGDPFQPMSQPRAVFIAGVEQPLTSRGLELRDRYMVGDRP